MTDFESIAKAASPQQREAFGKALREHVPREVHAQWHFERTRAVALERIQQSLVGRIASLIALRNERMAQSPFAYFRGSASLMALDLSETPPTPLLVQLCGDAHVRNFGTFAHFDGSIGFDINDFDETYRGPFEWDLKRLAASIVLAGREAKHDDSSCKEAVRACAARYRERMKDLAGRSPFEVLRQRANHEEHADVIQSLVTKAQHKSHAHLLDDLTELSGTTRKFKESPPLVTRVGVGELPRFAEAIESYRTTLAPAIQVSLEAWQLVDVAFKVVGVGSVGLAAYVALLTTGDGARCSILQLKQARESAVEIGLRALGLPTPPFAHQGQRVVEGQRAMQTREDPLVGYTTLDATPFMVRQLAENKAAIDDASVQHEGLLAYSKATGSILAASHAVTGDPVAIAAYLGNSDTFDHALSKFAVAYADQAADDFTAFVADFKSKSR